MPQFDISSFSSQLFWLAIIFTILYFIISRFIAPKVESIITARSRYMADNIKQAEDCKTQAKILDIEREENLTAVNERVENMQKQAMDIIESNFDKQKTELSKELDNQKQKSLVEIDQYINNFHSKEVEPCANLAAFIIEKITNKPADLELVKAICMREKE